jgi:hypothetical protein
MVVGFLSEAAWQSTPKCSKTIAAQRLSCATAKAPAQQGASPCQVQVNRPVAEGNCGGEIRPWEATGSELPVRNDQVLMSQKVNSIRWGATGECATITRNPELKPKLSNERQRETTAATANEPRLKKRQVTTEKPGRVHHMVGDRMAGSDGEISSELPTRSRNGVHAEVSRRADRGKSERP